MIRIGALPKRTISTVILYDLAGDNGSFVIIKEPGGRAVVNIVALILTLNEYIGKRHVILVGRVRLLHSAATNIVDTTIPEVQVAVCRCSAISTNCCVLETNTNL